jgi:hypothetical protein
MNRLGKVLTIILIGCSAIGFGQKTKATYERTGEYKNAFGVRAGGTSGLTYKHIFDTGNAIEGIIGIWPNAYGLTGLFSKHVSTTVEGLKWYYGGGAHITNEIDRTTYYDRATDSYYYRNRDIGFGIGVDGVVGLDYKIPVVPLAVSIDVKPFVQFNNNRSAIFDLDPGLGLKLAF